MAPKKQENVLGIIGLICAILGGLGVLILPFTLGFTGFISLPLSIAGLVCGLLGKRKVDRGELPGGRGIAQAGFIVGIVGVVLHVLAAIAAVVLLGLLFGAANDVNFQELEDGGRMRGGALRAVLPDASLFSIHR